MVDTNKELQKILDFSLSLEDVRVVMMNGSRLNVCAPVDQMQDYDIVFFIRNFHEGYKIDREWIKQFGEIVMIQQNDFEDGSYIFLMQFKSGLRIDLSFVSMEKLTDKIAEDSLSKILVDKDNVTPKIPEPNDSAHFVKKPTSREYDELLNEIWWIQTNIAKGLWREELPYVKFMYDTILMECIIQLVSWKIGTEHDFKVNVGKSGKWLERFLDEPTYNQFASLYSGKEFPSIWNDLFQVGDFVRKIGNEVGQFLGYTYPFEDDDNVTEYIKEVQKLPK